MFTRLPGALLFRLPIVNELLALKFRKGGVTVNKALALLVISILTLIAAACSPSGPVYTGGISACAEFRRIMAQAAQGNITDAEIKERLEKVQTRGSTAEPPIKDASTRVLATVTSSDGPGFSAASEDTIKACTEAGY